jgi:hypothetical protein
MPGSVAAGGLLDVRSAAGHRALCGQGSLPVRSAPSQVTRDAQSSFLNASGGQEISACGGGHIRGRAPAIEAGGASFQRRAPCWSAARKSTEKIWNAR